MISFEISFCFFFLVGGGGGEAGEGGFFWSAIIYFFQKLGTIFFSFQMHGEIAFLLVTIFCMAMQILFNLCCIHFFFLK